MAVLRIISIGSFLTNQLRYSKTWQICEFSEYTDLINSARVQASRVEIHIASLNIFRNSHFGKYIA